MPDLLCDNQDVMNALLAALSDPGHFTPRAPRESLPSWQRRAVIEHAAPYIEAAAEKRIYDLLGHDHYVIFTEDGWTTEHSVECRLSGHMHECAIHSAIGEWSADLPVLREGRWRVVSADGPVPVLERADGNPA